MREAGWAEALLGLSLSYNSQPSTIVAKRLAHKGGGHSKFLESMQVWLDVDAPRYWWSQADTYRVGCSKQSESTMHTILKHYLDQDDFEGGCDETVLYLLNNAIQRKDFLWAKRHLPESFLQRRIWNVNYMVLQNIVRQRKGHKLPEWGLFIASVVGQVEFPHYIVKDEELQEK
jgi:hypothetical protein